MFSHAFYNVLHIVGLALLVAALAGGAALGMATGTGARAATDAATGPARAARRLLAVLHGLGALLLLTGGFGMLARLGVMGGGFPGWIWVKLVLWVMLAAALVVPRRAPRLSRPMLLLVPLLVGLAAYMAIYKPL